MSYIIKEPIQCVLGTIDFHDARVLSLGRNGDVRAGGMVVDYAEGQVNFRTVKHNGEIATGHISMPQNPAMLIELAQHLQNLAFQFDEPSPLITELFNEERMTARLARLYAKSIKPGAERLAVQVVIEEGKEQIDVSIFELEDNIKIDFDLVVSRTNSIKIIIELQRKKSFTEIANLSAARLIGILQTLNITNHKPQFQDAYVF